MYYYPKADIYINSLSVLEGFFNAETYLFVGIFFGPYKDHLFEQQTASKEIYLELVYLVTALVPSETACLANSPGRRSLTAVWISREVMVDLLL